MTTKIAITGKSGSGKTTITKAFLRIIQETFPEKSILLFDNDLTGELGAFIRARHKKHNIRHKKRQARI